MGELDILYELQQVDLKLDQLRKTLKELPIYEQFKQLQNEVADAKEAVGWADNKLEEQSKRVRRLELDVEKAEEESKDIQTKLYSGAVKNSKELGQLESKGKVLLREQDKAEENVLLAMETKEKLQAALLNAKQNYKDLSEKLRNLQQQGNKEINVLKDKIKNSQEMREELVKKVNPRLLISYKEMRQSYHGRPLACIERDICGGCRVTISSNLINRVCNPTDLVFCENCGRILFQKV